MDGGGWWKKTRGRGGFLNTKTRLPLLHAFSAADGAEGSNNKRRSELSLFRALAMKSGVRPRLIDVQTTNL